MTTPKIGIYTAIYGRYDWVKPAPKGDVPKLFFTDNKDLAKESVRQGWDAQLVPHSVTTLNGAPNIVEPMLNHKFWKTHPGVAFPDMDYSIWIDGSFEVTVPDMVDIYLEALGTDDWSLCPHPHRNCIYHETELTSTLTWRYDSNCVKTQATHYKNWHPKNWGLFATGTNIRRHTPDVLDLCEKWWIENINWSHQDQMSLPVLLRLYQDRVKFNVNLRWHVDWILHPHSAPPT